MRTTRVLLLPLLLAALAGSIACSGTDDRATDDVATLDADADADTDGAGSGDDDDGGGGLGGRAPDPEFQDAMVAFAECMREHGVDMPDPQFDADGGGVIISGPVGGAGAAGGPPSDAQMEEVDVANEACQPILEEVEGSFPELDPEQEQEMRDQALEFAQCMRDHGIDMPDPIFDADGGTRVEIGIAGGPDGGAGAIDPMDEDFQEAQEACGEEIGFGPGFGFSVSSEGAAEDGE